MQQKNEKMFLVLKVIAFESQKTSPQNPEEDTCHWQSMYYQTPLRL